MIFLRRKKIDPRRRFGSREFRSKLRIAGQRRRPLIGARKSFFNSLLESISSHRKASRFLLALILITVFYFLVISDYFLVTNFTLSGYNQVTEEQIRRVLDQTSQSRTFLIPDNHLFILSQSRIEKLLIQNIPLIKEVDGFSRHWPDQVDLNVGERKAGFVLLSNQRFFLVDEEGVVIKEVEEVGDVPLVTDLSEGDVIVGEILPNPKLVAFIISMERSWSKRINSEITAIETPNKNSFEAHFRSSEGWEVFFDVNRSSLSQLGNLALILSRSIPVADRGRLAYIDLRLEKWAYYCFDNTPCNSTPQQNIIGEINNEE